MPSDNIQKKTFGGLAWTFLEKFSMEIFGFMQGIVLARLLMPSDYGLVAMAMVFMNISWTLRDAGFTQALIRNKYRKEIDYSTTFVTVLVLSTIIAGILSLFAPMIADFYHQPELRNIIYAYALMMVLETVNGVQGTKLLIDLQFKIRSTINVIVNVSIGLLTILLAYLGYGAWSLVYPGFLNIFMRTILYRYYQHWFPGFAFSWKSWKASFAYGSNMMLSGIIGTLYKQVSPLIIGRFFSAAQLGYYSKAHSYAALPAKTTDGMIQTVTFPILSEIQDDIKRLEEVYRRLIRMSAYVVFPMLMGLSALAKPFITILITEKWLPAVPYLQLLCFSLMWYPIQALNLNLLKVVGRSDLFLRLEIIKRILGLIVIFSAVPFGIMGMCVGAIINSYLTLTINTYYTGKFINVGFFTQIRDVLPSFIYSFTMGAVVFLSVNFISNDALKLAIGIPIGIIYYFGISKLFKSPDMEYVKLIYRQNVLPRFKRQK